MPWRSWKPGSLGSEVDLVKQYNIVSQAVTDDTGRNDFNNAVLNLKIGPDLFAPEIPSDYKVVEPLKTR